MRIIKQFERFNSAPAQVFKQIDDLGVTGMHMTQSSAMMMGSKLKLEFLTPDHTGKGSSYRWTGKMSGIKMDFTVEVKKWDFPFEKVWETVGNARLIIYSWYRMHLLVNPMTTGCQVELSISYTKPHNVLAYFISILVGGWYSRWCLKNMLRDTKKSLGEL